MKKKKKNNKQKRKIMKNVLKMKMKIIIMNKKEKL
jgi:hypothetical protein